MTTAKRKRASGRSPSADERVARGMPRAVAFSATPEDVATLDALCARWGVGRTAAIRQALALALETEKAGE